MFTYVCILTYTACLLVLAKFPISSWFLPHADIRHPCLGRSPKRFPKATNILVSTHRRLGQCHQRHNFAQTCATSYALATWAGIPWSTVSKTYLRGTVLVSSACCYTDRSSQRFQEGTMVQRAEGASDLEIGLVGRSHRLRPSSVVCC